jgi:protein-disulfide isomerase
MTNSDTHCGVSSETSRSPNRIRTPFTPRERQEALEDSDLIRYARAFGINAERVKEELAAGTYANRVRQDFRSGVRSGVNGTPTSFINSTRHDGSVDLEPFLEVLERAAQQ